MDHKPRFASAELREERLVRGEIRYPAAENVDQLRMQGQDVLLSMLRIFCFDDQRRLLRLQIETARPQAGDLVFPQSRQRRDGVDPRSRVAVVPLNDFFAGPCCRDQLFEFLGGQRSSSTTYVGFVVQSLYAFDWVCREPKLRRQPIAELLDRLDVVVERPMPEPVLLTHLVE
ncbi:MAG TPA: hypothetical protein VGN57_07100 [Pirellulaceae bacterium]|nr:hypothetical protein [Pirellulaceae bacterium]